MKAFISSLKKHLLTIAALSAFAFVFFTAGTLTAHAEDTEMSVYGIYLGDYGGDSTLVESRGEYLLMDLGSVNSYELIAQFLDGRGITGDTPISLYFSHLHSDHTGGFAAGNGLDRFLSDYNVQTLYVGDPQLFPETNDALQTRYDQIGSLCEAAGTEVVYLTVGSTFSFGDINTEIIGPVGLESVTNDYYNNDEGEESSSGDENLGLHNKYINNLSLIARLTCGNTVFLTTGDAEKLEEEKLCETYGEGLRADIYKLGHHGNQGSSTESFLSCVQPSWSFGLNSAKTGYFTDETSGLTYRKTYRARLHAAEYGIVYMTGDEQQAVCYRVINDSIGMYLEEDGFAVQPSGLLKLKGGIPHPQYPSGEESDVYDYSWYYLDESGNLLTGILTIDDKKYYFGEGGCREGGHYASDTGEYIAVLEHSEDHSDRRVFDENDGSMITRWYTEPGTGAQQYYDESTGIMYRGVSVIDGKEYLISEAGTLQTKTWKQFDAGNWKYYGKYGTAVTAGSPITAKNTILILPQVTELPGSGRSAVSTTCSPTEASFRQMYGRPMIRPAEKCISEVTAPVQKDGLNLTVSDTTVIKLPVCVSPAFRISEQKPICSPTEASFRQTSGKKTAPENVISVKPVPWSRDGLLTRATNTSLTNPPDMHFWVFSL